MNDHRELLKELNRQAENRRIREMEKEFAPLFWGVMLVFVVLMLVGMVVS